MSHELPELGSRWQHHNGNKYTIVAIANKYTQYPDEYPVTIVYAGSNGRIWSRPLSRWHASMIPLSNQPSETKDNTMNDAIEYKANHLNTPSRNCPVCGVAHTYIPADPRTLLKQVAQMLQHPTEATKQIVNLCEKHSELYNNGFIAIVGVDVPEDILKASEQTLEDAVNSPNAPVASGLIRVKNNPDIKRNGHIMHISADLYELIFDRKRPEVPAVFADAKSMAVLTEVKEDYHSKLGEFIEKNVDAALAAAEKARSKPPTH